MANTSALLGTLLCTNADINYYTQQSIYWNSKYEANMAKLEEQVKYEEKWCNAFDSAIDNTKTLSIKLDNKGKITLEDINLIKEKSKNIELDENTFNYICDLKDKLNVELAQAAPYISDRR